MVSTRNTRNDVIAAAGRLFAQRGYHGTSMRDLGRELGLQGSSLYSHITSKEDLLVEVVQRGADLFERSAKRATSEYETPPEQLRALVSGHIDVVLDHADVAKTFLDEARSLDDEYRDRILAARNGYEQAFRDVIAAGSASGAYSTSLDPKLSAIFVLSTLNAVERWFKPAGRLNRDQLVDELVDHIERSLS